MSLRLTKDDVGKKFVCRDGEVREITSYYPHKEWPYVLEDGYTVDLDGIHSFKHTPGNGPDLIERVIEEKTMIEFKTDVECPAGFEFTGEYRKINEGEYYLTQEEVAIWGCPYPSQGAYCVLRKIEPIQGWVNVYQSNEEWCFHPTKKKADKGATSTRIACVPVSYTPGEGLDG